MSWRIASVESRASETLAMALSGGLVFVFDSTDCSLNDPPLSFQTLACQLQPGAILDESAFAMLQKLDALHQARQTALALIARMEQGSRQLHDKLLARGIEPQAAHAAVAWALRKGFLDDVRYARMVLRDRCIRKGQGVRAAANVIHQRTGLLESPRNILQQALASFDDEMWYEACRASEARLKKKLAQKHAQETVGQTYRQLLVHWLRDQGFPPYAISRYSENN